MSHSEIIAHFTEARILNNWVKENFTLVIEQALADGHFLRGEGDQISLANPLSKPKVLANFDGGFRRAADCPAEVLSGILEYLDARTLVACEISSLFLSQVSNARWRRLAHAKFPMTRTFDFDKPDWREVYRNLSQSFDDEIGPQKSNAYHSAIPGNDAYVKSFELWNDCPRYSSAMLLQSGTMQLDAEFEGRTDDETPAVFRAKLSEGLKSLLSLRESGNMWARVAITRRAGAAADLLCVFDGWILGWQDGTNSYDSTRDTRLNIGWPRESQVPSMDDLPFDRSYKIQLPPPLPYHFPYRDEDDEHDGRDLPYRYVAGSLCSLGGTVVADSDPTSIVLKLIWSLDLEHFSATEAEFGGVLFDEEGVRLVPEPEEKLKMTMEELLDLLHVSKGHQVGQR